MPMLYITYRVGIKMIYDTLLKKKIKEITELINKFQTSETRNAVCLMIMNDIIEKTKVMPIMQLGNIELLKYWLLKDIEQAAKDEYDMPRL